MNVETVPIHTLYRFFSADDVLLYVGITGRLTARIKDHGKDQPWWVEVARATFTSYPTRADLEDAEIVAIILEKPKYNKRFNRRQCTCKNKSNESPRRAVRIARPPVVPVVMTNVLDDFLAARCRVGLRAPNAWTGSTNLFEAWSAFCETLDVAPGTHAAFALELKYRGFEKKRGTGGIRVMGVVLI